MNTTYFMQPNANSVWRATTPKAKDKMDRLSRYPWNFGKCYVPVPPAYAKELIENGWELVKVQDL